MRWRQLAAHSKNREFLNRVLPTREGFTRFRGSLALRKRRTPFHVAFDASAFFPYGISVENFRPKSVQKGDVRNSAANKLTPPRESARRQSARHETRHVRRHPLLRVPLREGARRARRRQGARRGRRAPRRAPHLRGPRRGQEEGYVAPIFLPSSIRLDRARARRRSRRSRGLGRVPRLDAIGRLAFRLRPRARAPGVAPDPPPVGSIESCSLLTASLFQTTRRSRALEGRRRARQRLAQRPLRGHVRRGTRSRGA